MFLCFFKLSYTKSITAVHTKAKVIAFVCVNASWYMRTPTRSWSVGLIYMSIPDVTIDVRFMPCANMISGTEVTMPDAASSSISDTLSEANVVKPEN